MPDLSAFPFPEVVDNTMIAEWRLCPHRFFRRHIQGLRPAVMGEPGEPLAPPPISIHLHFGGALARGIEIVRWAWYDTHDEDAALARGAAALVARWDSAPVPPPRSRSEEIKTLSACLMALAGYFREWPLDDPMQEVWDGGGKPWVEFSGAAPIAGTRHPVTSNPIVYSGRFDAVISRFGVLYGLDDKSTGSAVHSEQWRSQWRLRSQFTGYCWLAGEYGYKMNHFLVHGIQVLKTMCNYAEALTERPGYMIRQWHAQLVEDVNTMLFQYQNLGHAIDAQDLLGAAGPGTAPAFRRDLSDSCHAFGRACDYLEDLCAQPNPEEWVDKRYVVARWNPLERTET